MPAQRVRTRRNQAGHEIEERRSHGYSRGGAPSGRTDCMARAREILAAQMYEGTPVPLRSSITACDSIMGTLC